MPDQWTLCRDYGHLAVNGECPIHKGDACLRVYEHPDCTGDAPTEPMSDALREAFNELAEAEGWHICGQTEELSDTDMAKIIKFRAKLKRDAAPTEPTEQLYPCVEPGCDVLRTKAEGGTTFTVCDEHWEKRHGKRAEPTEDMRHAAWNAVHTEREYRLQHDVEGAGHIATGRAWDNMRHAHTKLQELLQAPTEPTEDMVERAIVATVKKCYGVEPDDSGYVHARQDATEIIEAFRAALPEKGE